jgi:hypothetical protein
MTANPKHSETRITDQRDQARRKAQGHGDDHARRFTGAPIAGLVPGASSATSQERIPAMTARRLDRGNAGRAESERGPSGVRRCLSFLELGHRGA